jgi:hypothetical protein
MLDTKEIASLVDMEKDILAHPLDSDIEDGYLDELLDDEIFTEAEIEDINHALQIILSNENLSDESKKDYLENIWRVNYDRRPPTPEEFLSSSWIGELSEELYEHIKIAFYEYFDPSKPYRNLCAYYGIGEGKTTLTALVSAYQAVLIYYLRNPKQFFKLSQMTHLVSVAISLTQDMCFDLAIRPLMGVFATSDRFEKVRTEDAFLKKVKQDKNKIYYTTAVKGNAVFRVGQLHYNVISEPRQLLGLTIVNGSATELAYMTEQGMTQDTVMRLINDLKRRIHSRLGPTNYFARTVIDSSPNTLESLIDQYLYYDCIKDPSVLRLMGTKWQLQPYLFPIWERTKEHFYIFRGSASKSPKVLSEDEVPTYDSTLLIETPIDALQSAKDDLPRFIRDYAGEPSSIADKLITNYETIEGIFTPSLRNIYSYCHAPASLPPEGLLWKIIRKEFFVYTGQGESYQFYRNPTIERFLAIDLAKNHDMATISLAHCEKGLNGDKVFIIDFSLAILPTKEEINMDAFKFLALDLVKYGGINLKKVSFDGFQSDTSRQWLVRFGIDAIRQSVDISVEPYMSFIAYMNQKRIHMGKNLIMKNNLKSLIMMRLTGGKLKVEHEQGEFVDLQKEDWDTSKMGYYGKDLSDSVVASVTLADLYGTANADYIYDETRESNREKGIGEALIDIKNRFNLRIAP